MGDGFVNCYFAPAMGFQMGGCTDNSGLRTCRRDEFLCSFILLRKNN